jgi:hypothetical protein
MKACERVISAEGLAPVPVDIPESFASLRPDPDEEKRKKEREEGRICYDFFLPGPLYSFALIDRSLVEGFRNQAGRPRDLLLRYSVFKFGRPLISHCGEWGSMLCVMDTRSFLYFKAWLNGMRFVNRAKRLVFITAFEQAAILDPFLLDGKNEIVSDAVTVLAPICKEWHAKPKLFAGIAKDEKTRKSEAPASIELDFVKPLPETLETLDLLADQLKI